MAATGLWACSQELDHYETLVLFVIYFVLKMSENIGFYIKTRCTRDQGRKSMFKHGGDNIVEKYTFRLRDELRGAKRPVFLGGFGGMPPPPPRKKF